MSAPEILISSNDAVTINRVIADLDGSAELDEAVADLSAKLFEARIVGVRALPDNIVRFHSTVTYEELPSRTRRRVTLVAPRDSNPSVGRISVLSPVGRALLGRREGEVVNVSLPFGRRISVRVAEALRPVLDEVDEAVIA